MLGLYDIINRHQIYLEDLKAGNVANYRPTLTAIDSLIREQLSSLPYATLSDMSKAAVRTFIAKFKKALQGVYNPWLSNQLKWFERYIQVDGDVLGTVFSPFLPDEEQSDASRKPGTYTAAALKLNDDKRDAIFAAWKNNPLGANGVLPVDMLTLMIATHINLITNKVWQGYAQGLKPTEVIQQIRGTAPQNYRDGLLQKFNNQVAASVNTVTQALAAQVNSAVASQIWEYYEWISVLDDRTTQICRKLDGKRFRYGAGPLPPAHVGCRSSIMPSDGDPVPDEPFGVWALRQSAAFKKDAFDGADPKTYQGAKAISLDQFANKAELILSQD